MEWGQDYLYIVLKLVVWSQFPKAKAYVENFSTSLCTKGENKLYINPENDCQVIIS